MHIVITGPGALGCLIAARLHRSGTADGHRVSLLDHDSDRAERLNSEGLHYEKEGRSTHFRLPVYSNPAEVAHADVLFVCVKSYDVDPTLDFLAPLIADGALPIFMQNGIAHLKHSSSAGNEAAVFATTTEGSTCLGPGHVVHAGAGITRLGFLKPPRPSDNLMLSAIIERLQAGGMKAEISESILPAIWTKLFVNIGINALTVIHNCPNGRLLDIPEAREQMELAVAEAVKVGKHEGIDIESPLVNTRNVCRTTAGNISSMLQDVRRKRRTEIDAINGMVVELAKRHGVETPVNSCLVKRIKEIEARY